ncbi:MAG: MerR family DNA-binding transcriptional regulator, partial [Candidatus Levyibacteriota bacterium]
MTKNLPDKKNFLSISKAAKYLGVSIDTIRRWDAKGKLKGTRLDGKNRYFTKEDLSQFKKEQPLPISEAAKMLSVSISTLRRFDESGLIVAQRDSKGARVYPVKELKEFLKSGAKIRKASSILQANAPVFVPDVEEKVQDISSPAQNIQVLSGIKQAAVEEVVKETEVEEVAGEKQSSQFEQQPLTIPDTREEIITEEPKQIPVTDFLSHNPVKAEETHKVHIGNTQKNNEAKSHFISISNHYNSLSNFHHFIPNYKKAVASLGVIILLSLGLFSFTVMKDLSGGRESQLAKLTPEERRLAVLSEQQKTQTGRSVLAESTASGGGIFKVNLETIFTQPVQILNKDLDIGTGRLTASNVVYSVIAGQGINVSGGQNPTISNTGVLSIGNTAGDIQLGTGLSISGNTLSSSLTIPAASNSFSTIKANGTGISAGSSSDTLEFLAGSGIGLSADTGNKKITISSTLSPATNDWTLSGNNLYPSSTSYSVGIGNTAPAATLDVTGTFKVSGTTTFNSQAYTWPNSTGSPGYVLMTDGAGGLSWTSSGGAGTNYFAISGGSIYPVNDTLDFLLGASSTASAKFAVTNVNSGNVQLALGGGSFTVDSTGLLSSSGN